MSKLDFISTDDLVKELMERVDVGIIVLYRVGIRNDQGDGGSHGEVTRRWKGPPFLISGLATDMSMLVLRKFHQSNNGEELGCGVFS